MPSPPACIATLAPFGERITAADPDLSTTNGQKRYLMTELGLTRQQASALLRAYALDERDRRARQASALEFGNWLTTNWPADYFATFGAVASRSGR